MTAIQNKAVFWRWEGAAGAGGEMFSLPEIQSCLSESGLPQCTFSHMNKGKNRPPWWKGSARAELADRWKMRHLPSVRWPSSRSKAQAARQLQDLSFLPRKKSLDYQALDQIKNDSLSKTFKECWTFQKGGKTSFYSKWVTFDPSSWGCWDKYNYFSFHLPSFNCQV